MNCSTPVHKRSPGFAVWLTGLPASGKTTIALRLQTLLRDRGVHAVLLDSDLLRDLLTPQAAYHDSERDRFYAMLVGLAELLVQQGTPVLIAATGNRRRYRQAARDRLDRFLEVFVDCPLEVCKQRDPKGLYEQASMGRISRFPGVDQAYELPIAPDLIVYSDRDDIDQATQRITACLFNHGWLS